MSPSYRIVFYVSGHGFGHTSRTVEVIHALLRARPDTRVVVRTSAPRRLFERTLQGQIEFVEFEGDTGMVQRDSLSIDLEESLRRATEFQRQMPQLAATEATYLRAYGADVVVGDIPPLAFAAAGAAGVPSIAIGNFTWDWIYDAYPDHSTRPLVDAIRAAYQTATLALRLPMAAGFEGLESFTRDIPFIARRSQRDPDDVRQMLGLPARARGKPLVLMSFGGYGVSGLDTAALASLTDYTIATTDIPAREHTSSRRPACCTFQSRSYTGEGCATKTSYARPTSWRPNPATASSAKPSPTTRRCCTHRAVTSRNTTCSSAKCRST